MVLPEGLQEEAARVARWEADLAGDLMCEENPYAVGQPKFGYDFCTGQPVEPAKPKNDWSWKGKPYGGDGGGGSGQKRQRGGNRGRGQSQADILNIPYVPQPYAMNYHAGPLNQAGPFNFAGPPNFNGYTNFAGHLNQGWVAQGQQHANRQVNTPFKGGKNHGKGNKHGRDNNW